MATKPLHVLCDMDGTIIDTEGLKDEAWRKALGEVTHVLPDPVEHRKFYASLVGRPGMQIAVEMVERYGLSATPDELWKLREKHRRMLYSDSATLRSLACNSIIDFVRRLREGFAVIGEGSIVLVTTAGSDQVEVILDALGIGHLFDRVICGLEKTRGNPECYRAVLTELRCQPGDCLAIEDSLVGYEAARSLGIPCLLLPNDYTKNQRPRAS